MSDRQPRSRHDADALAAFYERHGGAAFSLATRILRDSAAAERAVEQAFASLWQQPDVSGLTPDAIRTTLLTLVRVHATPRRHAARVAHQPLAAAVGEVAGIPAWLAADGGMVRVALASLTPEQRHVIELAYFGGLTCPEVARTTSVPVEAVHRRMRVALEQFRSLLVAQVEGRDADTEPKQAILA